MLRHGLPRIALIVRRPQRTRRGTKRQAVARVVDVKLNFDTMNLYLPVI
jgi:hypothetical protein